MGIWFEILVVAGIFISALLLYCILLDINHATKQLVKIDDSIKDVEEDTSSIRRFVRDDWEKKQNAPNRKALNKARQNLMDKG